MSRFAVTRLSPLDGTAVLLVACMVGLALLTPVSSGAQVGIDVRAEAAEGY